MLSLILICLFTIIFFYYSTKNIFSYQLICFSITLPAIFFSEYITGLILSLSFLFFSIGGVVYNIVLSVNVNNLLTSSYSNNFFINSHSLIAMRTTAYILGFIAIFFSSIYFAQVGISLFADEVGTARLVNRNAASGSFIYQRIFRILFPTVVILFYIIWLNQSYKSPLRILRLSSVFLIFFIITNASFLAFTGMKANVITFLFFPILIFHNLFISKISIINALWVILFSVGIVLFMVYKTMPSEDFLTILNFILFRLGAGATDGLHYVIHSYEPQHGLQYGATFLSDIMSIFGKLGFEGIESLTLGQKIALELLGSNYMGEQAAVTMAGELYLNFGYVGLVIFSTLIGFLMQYLYVFTLRNSNKPLKSIFLAYFQVAMIMILGGPVFSMALDYVIFMFIFYLFWRIIYSSIYLTKRRN